MSTHFEGAIHYRRTKFAGTFKHSLAVAWGLGIEISFIRLLDPLGAGSGKP